MGWGQGRRVLMVPSLPQIGVWYSNRTLAMNATTLDINLSQTLANKTLVVTTILVSGPGGGAVGGGAFPERCPSPVLVKEEDPLAHTAHRPAGNVTHAPSNPDCGQGVTGLIAAETREGTGSASWLSHGRDRNDCSRGDSMRLHR